MPVETIHTKPSRRKGRGETIGQEHMRHLRAGWYYRVVSPGVIPSEFDWVGPYHVEALAFRAGEREEAQLGSHLAGYCAA